MSKPNVLEREHEKEMEVMLIFIYRVPKKNHDAIVQLNKQIKNMLPIHGPLSTQNSFISVVQKV